MADVKSIEPGKYNSKLADALRDIDGLESPEWIEYVKTSNHKKRPVNEENFWNKRAASILRQLYIHGIVGVGSLRTRYGGRKDRGKKPAEFRKSGGKIIRLILQQLEKAEFVEKVKEGKSGRRLTKKGKDFLEKVAGDSK